MRGTVPKALGLPWGLISVIWSPTRTPSRCAMRSPIATRSSPKLARLPSSMWSATVRRRRRSSGRTPRITAPEAEPLAAEAVHHRHHDDQRRHPQRDAEEGEARNDRDEPLLAACPEVAHRDHALEGREDHELILGFGTPVSPRTGSGGPCVSRRA